MSEGIKSTADTARNIQYLGALIVAAFLAGVSATVVGLRLWNAPSEIDVLQTQVEDLPELIRRVEHVEELLVVRTAPGSDGFEGVESGRLRQIDDAIASITMPELEEFVRYGDELALGIRNPNQGIWYFHVPLQHERDEENHFVFVNFESSLISPYFRRSSQEEPRHPLSILRYREVIE